MDYAVPRQLPCHLLTGYPQHWWKAVDARKAIHVLAPLPRIHLAVFEFWITPPNS
jgi:hypothetical protein